MDLFIIEPAKEHDAAEIVSVLVANRHDRGLLQQPKSKVESNLGDFLVARDSAGRVVGCAAVHRHTPTLAEVLSVAVLPERQGRGIGIHLLRECELTAKHQRIEQLWLATIKPAYFARFGYRKFSRWELPASVLLRKLRQVFQQSPTRWLPALFGRHTFMKRQISEEAAN